MYRVSVGWWFVALCVSKSRQTLGLARHRFQRLQGGRVLGTGEKAVFCFSFAERALKTFLVITRFSKEKVFTCLVSPEPKVRA